MKHEEEHAEGIQGRDEHAEQNAQVGNPVDRALPVPVRLPDSLDEQILGEKARRARESDQRQRSDQRRPVRDRHVLANTAHLTNVLLVVHRDDDRSGGKEQQRLEERVSHQVKDRRAVGRRSERHGHVAELR